MIRTREDEAPGHINVETTAMLILCIHILESYKKPRSTTQLINTVQMTHPR